MKTLKITSLFFVIATVIFSCKQDEDEPTFSNSSFVQAINAGGVPEEVQSEEVVLDSSVTDQTMPDGSTWVCTSKRYSVVDGNSDFPLFNPNASVIYPGSLLQGKTLSNSTPSIIPVDRAGGTISIDVIDGNLQPSFTVDKVSKSKIAEAANAIISGSTGVVPANFNFTAKQIQSTEQLAISLGLNVETQFVEVASQFSFRRDKEYNRFLVKLNQSFYTLSFDIPSSIKDIFAPGVTPQELGRYIGPGNPATFISDVTYGRVYYMLIESTSNSTAIEAAIQASFSTPTVSGGLDVNTNYLSSLSEMQIKVVALGGEAQSTFATIGETNIAALVTMLGASTDIRSGVPISYVVRSVVSKEIVSVKLATEYEVKECVALSTPLGNPLALWDASVFEGIGNIPPCVNCLETNGKYRYYGPNDSYARDNFNGPDGTVVKRWPDISGNNIHASAIAGEPDSRPMFAAGAFNNGLPAVEFFRGSVAGEYVDNRLTYSGDIFVNTDYTIIAVVSYPDLIKVEWRNSSGHWITGIAQPNRYGYFMHGTSSEPLNQLILGFQNSTIFRLSHRQYQLFTELPNFKPSPQWKVIAVTFSKTSGMAIYENGVLIAKNASVKQALVSNPGAIISAPYPGSDAGVSRIRIGEIRAYGVAATEAQIKQETVVLNRKFGL